MTRPETMTVAQTAAALHRTPCYVRGLIRDHKLQAVRLTQRGNWLILFCSLAALLGVKLEMRERERTSECYRQRANAARAGLEFEVEE